MITHSRLVLLVAVILAATDNLAFFRHVTAVYPWHSHAGFLVALAVLLVAVNALLIELFSLLMPTRLAAALMILLAAVTGYFSDQFGTIINTDMIRNVLQTDVAEATDLFSSGLLVRILLLGILPALLVWWIPLRHAGWRRELRYRFQGMALALLTLVLVVLPVSDTFASFVREHKTLRYYSNPATPVYSAARYLVDASESRQQRQFTTVADRVTQQTSGQTRRLVIVVVGETARADHFSLNGYERETNPRLAAEDRLVSYTRFSSCGTDTAISVPCMFSFDGKDTFDSGASLYRENALDVLARAGVNVLWRDNNSGSKGVADRVSYEDFHQPGSNPACDVECRDEGMLSGLQDYIDNTQGDMLIVLHQMGSHGPAYFKRYPQAFEKFKPACHEQELSACSHEEIVNAYDNTLLYTDYFLSRVIELLKTNTPQYSTAMLYISDHGESLGENGIYLHGMPYLLAPGNQTHVPAILWVGATSDIDYAHTLSRQGEPVSHDTLASSLLALFDVRADFHEPLEQVARLFYKQDPSTAPGAVRTSSYRSGHAGTGR